MTKHVVEDDIYSNSYHLTRLANTVLWMVIITFILQASEAIVLSFHVFDFIDHGKMRTFSIFRRFFSFGVEITGILLLIWMKVAISKGKIFDVA